MTMKEWMKHLTAEEKAQLEEPVSGEVTFLTEDQFGDFHGAVQGEEGNYQVLFMKKGETFHHHCPCEEWEKPFCSHKVVVLQKLQEKAEEA